MAYIGDEKLAKIGQDNSSGLRRKRFIVEMNPAGTTVVSWRRLLKRSPQSPNIPEQSPNIPELNPDSRDDEVQNVAVHSTDEYDFDDSELNEKECSRFLMKYRENKSAGDSDDSGDSGDSDGESEKSAGDDTSAPREVEMTEVNAGAPNVFNMIKLSSHGCRLEKAIKDLENAVAENPRPVVRQYLGKADKQYLPPNVRKRLKEATMLYLEQNGRFSEEFINRVKSILGGMTKHRNLKVYLKRRLEAYASKLRKRNLI